MGSGSGSPQPLLPRHGGAPWPGGAAGGSGPSIPSCASSGGTRCTPTWLSCSGSSRLYGGPHSMAETWCGPCPPLCCSLSKTPARHCSAGIRAALHTRDTMTHEPTGSMGDLECLVFPRATSGFRSVEGKWTLSLSSRNCPRRDSRAEWLERQAGRVRTCIAQP